MTDFLPVFLRMLNSYQLPKLQAGRGTDGCTTALYGRGFGWCKRAVTTVGHLLTVIMIAKVVRVAET